MALTLMAGWTWNKTMRDDESTKPWGMMKAQNHVHNSQITLNTKP
jgi:hypothetical protein